MQAEIPINSVRECVPMSALGQKPTYALQQSMSALPPIADMRADMVHVRFVPIADMPQAEPAQPAKVCTAKHVALPPK
jgi:hypothetical protein